MERHAAEFESSRAVRAQASEQRFERFKQRIEPRQRIEIRRDDRGHRMDDVLCRALVGHDHVNDADLRGPLPWLREKRLSQ